MSAPTKRKRGHAKRHPWSAFCKFRASDEGERLSNMAKPAVIYSCFMAGYRAGKDAK